jgi:hypothetical protein
MNPHASGIRCMGATLARRRSAKGKGQLGEVREALGGTGGSQGRGSSCPVVQGSGPRETVVAARVRWWRSHEKALLLCRNRKVFNDVSHSVATMVTLFTDYLLLWVCRAKCQTDTEPLVSSLAM